MTIGQQERQTIRLLASPPAGLPDGEYWARLIVSAKGGQVPVAGVPDSGAITVGLTLEVRTVIAVVYRKGALTTGVTLAPPSATYANDTVAVRVPMTRTGTAAYVGTARVRVVDAKGALKGEDERALGVYYTLDPRVDIPVGPLAPGTYKVVVTLSTDRGDLPAEGACCRPRRRATPWSSPSDEATRPRPAALCSPRARRRPRARRSTGRSRRS